jgi:hypothetical protein
LSDVLTINGSTINMTAFNASLDRLTPITKGGIPELQFSRLLGPLTTIPDAWSGKSCTLTMGGTLVFSGTIQGYADSYHENAGWVREYRALGLRNSADYIPVTDSITYTDTCAFNLPGDDANWIGSRAGQTVGQIVTSVLTMTANASSLSAAGIGAYTSLAPPTLPALTTSDLSALTFIPFSAVYISGERILQALESFVQSYHPNHWLHIQPDGTIRFLDQRLAAATTLTLGSDPRLDMPQMTRDFSDCYSQVEVRGNANATPVILQTTPWPGSSASDGGLQEDFAWGALTNAAAKAAYVPADYNQPNLSGGNANDKGHCTCPDTLHVTVTSSDATTTWAANFWGQSSTEAQGVIYLYADVITGISQVFAARIVANTALVAAGTSTLTLDRALPAITYNSYAIWGLAEDASVVYRKYKVTNTNVANALLNYFPYPVPVKAPGLNALALTSTPIGFTEWSSTGSAPYNVASMAITVDPVNGLVYFERPTALIFGPQVTPVNNVIAFLAVANGSLNTFAPSSSSWAGTLYSVEGIQRTKVLTMRDWRDASNSTNAAIYASEYLDSVKDVVVECTLPYHGLLSTFLTCGSTGRAVTIAGSGYTTGLEAITLPVVSVDVTFNNGPAGTSYDMVLRLSNRRGRYTADGWFTPSVTGQQLGTANGVFGADAPIIPDGPTGPMSAWEVGGASKQAQQLWAPWLSMGNAYSAASTFGPGTAPDWMIPH